MAITDPEAIRFTNEVVRPLSEQVRALSANINAARAKYDALNGPPFYGHGEEAVEDGREADGVSRLIGDDVLAFVAVVLDQAKDLFNTNAATISKPCVRMLL
jgi:hypothetical protein